MENNKISLGENEYNLYKYSDIDLVSMIKYDNDENTPLDNESKKKREFLIELTIFLEKKMKNCINAHQEGYKIYKQKLLAEKTFIKNSIKKEIMSLTINQLIALLIKIRNSTEKANKYFNIGQNTSNPSKNYSIGNSDNINSNQIETLNKIFSDSNMKNNQFLVNNNIIQANHFNNFQKKFDNSGRNNLIHGLPVKKVYPPSPMFYNKIDSKILKENEHVNNQINFNEDQKIINN